MDQTAPEAQNRLYPPSALLTALLRDVSRTFYQTLRVLPGSIRPQIGLAYLLARTTDTVADTEIVPVAERLESLRALRERILRRHNEPLDLRKFAQAYVAEAGKKAGQGSMAEKVLLERVEQMFTVLQKFSDADQRLVREVLSTITSGQELDLQRFGEIKPGEIRALASDKELDDYTYRVAGCVGEFWTRMCRAHLFPKAALDEGRLLADGVRFGKGLQLVNILRDLPSDLRQGRCYVPTAALGDQQMAPADLLAPGNESRFRPLYNKYLAMAEAHLAAGWNYTNTLPRGCFRVRLACAWPILIGVRTLAKLRVENVLDPSKRIKVTRSEVKSTILGSLVASAWPPAWRALYAKAQGK